MNLPDKDVFYEYYQLKSKLALTPDEVDHLSFKYRRINEFNGERETNFNAALSSE